MTDIEQQHHDAEKDKPTLSNSATPLRTSWARRLVPTKRYARYLCFGTIFAVVVSVVAFLALWFTTKHIVIVPETRLQVYQTDASPVQWKLDGTVIKPQGGMWGIMVMTLNENVFDVVLQDVDMTAMISHTDSSDVLLGTNTFPQPEVLAPAKRTLEVMALPWLSLRWDLSISEQARSLASLLVLCGVNATSLPAPLTSRWDLPDPRNNETAMVKWQVRAGRVRGLMGLPMPSTVDVPQGFSVITTQRVEDVFCSMDVENRGKVAGHVQQLANLTVLACESGKCQ